MTEELKPCPFCGSSRFEYGYWGWIGCQECGAKVAGRGSVDSRDAWNRRATPAPAQPEADVRKAFEKWATHNGFAVHRNGGDQYVNTPTHHAWNGWKGASEAGAAAPVEGAAWQPIETAPKDESVLLTDGQSVGEGFWHNGTKCHGHRGGPGWFWEIDRGDLLIASNARATHWMPLPAAPKEKP